MTTMKKGVVGMKGSIEIIGNCSYLVSLTSATDFVIRISLKRNISELEHKAAITHIETIIIPSLHCLCIMREKLLQRS